MSSASGPATAARDRVGVRSVERCIDIVNLLARNRQGLSLSVIARELQIPKSTVLTIARTLVARGWLSVDAATKTYRLGLGFLRFVEERPALTDLAALATPYLRTLAEHTRETATLALCENDAVYYVARMVGPQPLQYVVPVGIARPLHGTAGGKIFLAHMAETQRAAILSRPLEGFTARTVTDVTALRRQLTAARKAGYAITRGETSPDLFGIAAPIFDPEARVVAAVNLGGPLFRLRVNQAQKVEAVRGSAAAISAELRRMGGAVERPHLAPAAIKQAAELRTGDAL